MSKATLCRVFLRWKINIKLKHSLYKIETKILLSEDNLFSKSALFFAYQVFAWNSNKDDSFFIP